MTINIQSELYYHFKGKNEGTSVKEIEIFIKERKQEKKKAGMILCRANQRKYGLFLRDAK